MASLASSPGSTSPGGTREASSLKRYYETVRGHVRLIAACVAVCLLAAIAYVKVAPRSYTAEAQMLVNPASPDDTDLFSLPVLHSTGDPTQDVLTASALITTPQIAQAVVTKLHLNTTAAGLLGKIQATPLDQSNIVALEATASTPAQAQRLANEFAAQVVVVRTAALRKALAVILPGLTLTVARLPAAERNGVGTLGDELTQLEQLQSSNDPTISVAATATLPASPTSPRTGLSLAAGLFVGLLIGIGAAFAFDALDPRVQREDQLRERFSSVPVLARIPQNRGIRKPGPLVPLDLPASALEQYRTLRATLTARSSSEAQAYLLTGSAPSEGKTTSAINLAAALAQGGANVILIEADLRRPTIGNALGLQRFTGMEQVLSGEVEFAEALSQVRLGPTSFRVLAAHGHSAYQADRLSLAAARELVYEAKRMADVVVIDSPPLTAVIDALPIAQVVDEIVVAVRIGYTKLSELSALWELLGHQGMMPGGIVLIGVPEPDELGYGYHLARDDPRAEPRVDDGHLAPLSIGSPPAPRA